MYLRHCVETDCKELATVTSNFCNTCYTSLVAVAGIPAIKQVSGTSMSVKYPKYYKAVGNLKEIDVYQVHQLFNIQDPSGCIQHASKKLLLSGVRTGGKSALDDIKEARDTLTRYIEINSGVHD